MILWVTYSQIVKYNRKIAKLYPQLLIINIIISTVPSTFIAIASFLDLKWKGAIEFSPAIGDGQRYLFCDIDPPVLEFILADVPEFATLIITVVFILRIMKILREVFKNYGYNEVKNIIIYPAVMSLLWIFPVIDTFLFYKDGTSPFLWLCLHIMSNRLQGFITAVTFGMNKFRSIRNQLKRSKISNVMESEISQNQDLDDSFDSFRESGIYPYSKSTRFSLLNPHEDSF